MVAGLDMRRLTRPDVLSDEELVSLMVKGGSRQPGARVATGFDLKRLGLAVTCRYSASAVLSAVLRQGPPSQVLDLI